MIISLTNEQRKRAHYVREQVDNENIDNPTDLVDTWEPEPDIEDTNISAEKTIR